MRKSFAAIAVASALMLGVSGCTLTPATPPQQPTSAPQEPATPAPELPEIPEGGPDKPTSPEGPVIPQPGPSASPEAYDEAFDELIVEYFGSAEFIEPAKSIAHNFCTDLVDYTYASTFESYVNTGVENGMTPEEMGYILGMAVPAYCPEYTAEAEEYLNSF